MVTETEKTKAPVNDESPRSTGGMNRPGKFVKMIQARCQVCNPQGQGKRGWWENCEHDLYRHIEARPGAEQFEEREDGTIVKLDKPKLDYRKVYNWKQIADDPGVASARMVRIQRERGSKYPAELGLSPRCDYNNCWEKNPEVHVNRVFNIDEADAPVRGGDYHDRNEAAMMVLRLSQTPVYVGVGPDIRNRQQQLDEVNIV